MAVWWPRSDAAERTGCGQSGACVLARFFYAGGMRKSIILKSFIIIAAGVVVVGGGVFVGFRHAPEVRGDAEPLELSETYTHAELGFSFRYPRAFRVNEIPQGEGNALVLVEDPLHARQGFQVFSMPYDEGEPLTSERIRQDVPDIAMENAHPFRVAGVSAISFVQLQTPDVGTTYEVWFVHDGTLYEVATYAAHAADLHAILATWTFHP
jgi:hypothetical protein